MLKGINKIIPSYNSNHTFPSTITINNETITNLSDIANALNNYFAKVAVDMQSSIRFCRTNFRLPPDFKYTIILYNSH